MLVFTTDGSSSAIGVAPPLRWRALRIDTKTALPIADMVVVAGVDTTATATARQLTCLGGRVQPSPHRLLLVLPLPAPANGATAAIQVLEMGECAVHLLRDVKACFPSLVRKNPLADSDSDDADDDSDESESERQRKQDEAAAKAQAEAQARAVVAAAAAAPFLAATRVRVLPSMAALHDGYAFASPVLVDAIERDVTQQFPTTACTVFSIQFLCIEFPPNAPPLDALNFGVVFAHAHSSSSPYLEIPLPREPLHFFPMDEDQDPSSEPVVWQDATVYTFGAKRESSQHGGGKTPNETVHNIRLRHASGTFCTLVYPKLEWENVAATFQNALPQLRGLTGELRARRFMGVVPNRPIEILLET